MLAYSDGEIEKTLENLIKDETQRIEWFDEVEKGNNSLVSETQEEIEVSAMQKNTNVEKGWSWILILPEPSIDNDKSSPSNLLAYATIMLGKKGNSSKIILLN